MPILEAFTGSEAISTTEHSLVTDTAGPDVSTSDGIFQVFLDLSDMVQGDELQIRVYEKVQVGDTQRIVYETKLIGPQSTPIWISPPLILMNGWDITLDAIAGTITVSWSIRTPVPDEMLFALRFPRNTDVSNDKYVALEIDNPEDDDLPITGPSDAGVTVIRRIRVRQQTPEPVNDSHYYAQFWYTNANRTFDTGHYWGFHPYPQGGNPGTDPDSYWEIAVRGNDFVDTLAANQNVPEFDRWYIQAITVTKSGNAKTLTFWIDLLSTDDSDIIEHSFSNTTELHAPATSSLLVIGDSPWWEGFQHERGSFDLAQIKIFNAALSEADILSEAADMDSVVTAAGEASKWFIKYGWADVDDLTCDEGTGRTWHWETADKATLVDLEE